MMGPAPGTDLRKPRESQDRMGDLSREARSDIWQPVVDLNHVNRSMESLRQKESFKTVYSYPAIFNIEQNDSEAQRTMSRLLYNVPHDLLAQCINRAKNYTLTTFLPMLLSGYI